MGTSPHLRAWACVNRVAEHEKIVNASRRLSLRAKGHKLIWSSSHWLDTVRVEAKEQHFDLARDPGELEDLQDGRGDAPGPFQELWKQLRAWRDATATLSREREIDDEVFENLRKLGYL